MPNKSEVNDYEGVSRSGTRRHTEEVFNPSNSKDSKLAGRLQKESTQHSFTPDEQLSSEESSRKIELSREDLTIKRGHALSFAGLFLFTAFVFLRPYELVSSLSWLKTGAFWIAIFTMLVFLVTQLGLENKVTILPKEIKLILLLLLAGMLSVPLAFSPLAAWYGFTEFLKVVLMFIIMVNVTRTEKRLKALILFALLVSCLVSAAAVNDYRLGRFVLGFHERIQGLVGNLFDNPNDLALHLVTMIPLSLGLLFTSRSFIRKLLFGGCAVLMTAGTVATFSRGGFIGLVCVGALLAWRLAKNNKFLIVAALPIALLLFIFFAPGGYGTRIATTADQSGVARREELKRSLFVTIHHPLVGVGMENYILYSDINHATHNAYTQVASEMGLPALVIYILFLITPLKDLRRIGRETSAARRKSPFYYLAIGLEASLIGYMVSSFFLSVAYLWYVYYLVGYAICFRRLYQASQTEESSALSEGTETAKKVKGSIVPRVESAPILLNNR